MINRYKQYVSQSLKIHLHTYLQYIYMPHIVPQSTHNNVYMYSHMLYTVHLCFHSVSGQKKKNYPEVNVCMAVCRKPLYKTTHVHSVYSYKIQNTLSIVPNK